MRRASNKAFKNYEDPLATQLAQISAHDDFIRLHESLLAMILCTSSLVDDSQPIHILSSTGGRDIVDNQHSNEHIIQAIKYDNIVSSLRQCDAGSNNIIKSTDNVYNTMH